MMRPRLLQNFRGLRALIIAPPSGVESLAPTLERLGLTVRSVAAQDPSWLADLSSDRDVLFVDADLVTDLAASLGPSGQPPPAPVIALTSSDAPSRLRALMELGATGLVRKPVHPAALYPALYLSINQFRAQRDLLARLAEHDRRRQGRRFLIKAIVRLMQERGMSDDEAYDLLRQESMRARLPLEHYCEQLLARRTTKPDGTETGKDMRDASDFAA